MAEPQRDSEKVAPSLTEKDAGVLDRSPDDSSAEIFIDRAKEVKLLAKLDLAFTPVIMLVYLSCFLDRSNIGMRCLASKPLRDSRRRANSISR